MTEIEVKVLEIDSVALKQKLTAIGAKQTFAGELRAMFYDFPEETITQKNDVLRLRKEGNQIMLTYKAFISQGKAKIMEEHEVGVTDMEKMNTILTLLGLTPIKETQKYREEYLWRESKIVLDKYKGELDQIPMFLEIEAPDQEHIRQTLEVLGYSEDQALNWSTYDLVQHYYH